MKVVAIRNMNRDEQFGGDTWEETKLFDGTTPISEIVRWAADGEPALQRRLTITVPEGEQIQVLPKPKQNKRKRTNE